MLKLNDDFNSMLLSRAGTIINLYELYYHKEAEPLRFTNDSEDISYKASGMDISNTYYAMTIKHSDISYASDGSVNDVTLTVGNAERQIQFYIERYELIHKKIVIRQVYINLAGMILGDVETSYIIKSIRVTATQADFTLSMGFDMFKAVIPGRRIFSKFCSHAFRDSCCCYKGGDNTCSKTFAECKRKGNVANFGGFPGVKNERLYF